MQNKLHRGKETSKSNPASTSSKFTYNLRDLSKVFLALTTSKFAWKNVTTKLDSNYHNKNLRPNANTSH